MTRWPFIVMAVAAIVFVATACAPPPPPVEWYDAANDVIHYDDAAMQQVSHWYGQAGLDWINAHAVGHRTEMRVWLNEHVAIWTLMPGPGAGVQIEQAAQCLAEAKLGHQPPWQWSDAQVALGYWDCDADHVAAVEAWA